MVSVIGLGFLACSNDNNEEQVTPLGTTGNTYVSVSINMASQRDAKALPEDYNPDGTYDGIDGVKSLDIYMVSTDGSVEAKRFGKSELSTTGTVLKLNEPLRTTSGSKSLYVVLNNPNALGTAVPKDDDLLDTAGLAQIVNDGSFGNVAADVIMMTGKNPSIFVSPDVSQQAASSGDNNFSVTVTRVASRVIVTSTAGTDLLDQDGNKIGTISNVTYSVAQGANKVYFAGKSDFTTWGSEYVTALGNYTTEAPKYYDYSDLSTPSPVPAKPANDDYKSLQGKFLFENTHATGDIKTSGYKKGNTAYVLIKAKFTPDPSAVADGGTLTNGTFYIGGSDGKIYSSKAAAQAAVTNQKAALHEQGKVLYYAWLNPDNVTRPLNSPVLRNNIYHININSFAKIGLNWNPLYPEDPDNPNPGNPDPKPGDPDNPVNPVDPTDPLTPEETYMNVDISVLEWTVHSYDIDLQ